VLVVHPREDALVTHLARLAGWATARELPEAEASAVLVTPATGEAVTRYRDAGARVFPPERLGEALRPGEVAPPPPIRLALDGGAAAASPVEPAPLPPVATGEPPAPVEPPRPDPRPASPTGAAGSAPGGLPGDAAWRSPAAMFTWLVEATPGAADDTVLWWDVEGRWCPVAAGSGAAPGTGEPPAGTDLTTALGRFRLTGDDRGALSRDAVVRLAEDFAYRDLAAWRETRDRLTARLAGTSWDREAVEDLVHEADALLGGSAVLAWVREGDAWALTFARGADIRLDGTLVLPEALLGGAFPASQGWREWRAAPGLRLRLRFAEDDPSWSLRFARLESLAR
jgi:hypothetical protein